MKKLVLLACSIVTLSFSLGGVVQASADPQGIAGGGMKATFKGSSEEYVSKARYAAGGGDFACGVNGFKVWARYDHSRLTHSATAMNGWGGSVRDKQGAGRRAYATCNASLTGNTGWWNIY